MMREVAMLRNRERRVSLEGRGHLVHQKSGPKLSKNFHEHDRADVLNAFGGIFGNGDKPFPFPEAAGM